MLMLINVVNRKDDSFCIFLTLSRHWLIDGSWDQGEGYAPALTDRLALLRSARWPGRRARPQPDAEIGDAFFNTAIRRTANLRDALTLAQALVRKRELRNGFPPPTLKSPGARISSRC
jgi:hypothetical protein